uniref:Uncharacterized protein n=1 Tax=Knipowitschia caucasica TaxID=637954 RepID=A0AAV2K681_KNICA
MSSAGHAFESPQGSAEREPERRREGRKQLRRISGRQDPDAVTYISLGRERDSEERRDGERDGEGAVEDTWKPNVIQWCGVVHTGGGGGGGGGEM